MSKLNKVGIIAKKVGMSHVFEASGRQVPVTILSVEDCSVLENRVIDGKKIVIIGAFKAKEHRVRKPQLKYFEKVGSDPKVKIKEFVVEEFTEDFKPNTKLDFSMFQKGSKVDISGKSSGKGFSGVMKRYGFAGGNASHGASKAHRLAGSTGHCQDPGRHFKGTRMAGRMGNQNAVTLNLQIVEVQGNKMFVKGSVLGPKNSFVIVMPGRLQK